MSASNRKPRSSCATDPTLIPRRDLLKGGSLAAVVAGMGRPPDVLSVPGRATGSVILLTMVGGASPWETFDPKPDAPSRFRGPIGSIATAVPGVRVAEGLPEVARRMKSLTLIRSVYHDGDPTHEAGLHLLTTGRSGPGHPPLGSVAALELGARGGMPPYVVLPSRVRRIEGSASVEGVLGSSIPALEPFIVGRSAGSPRFDPSQLADRARRWVDLAAARGLDGAEGSRFASRTPADWDWNRERSGVRDGYGDLEFARNCWLAGRLVEAGSRLVVVNMARTVFGEPSWDAHGRQPFGTFDDYTRRLLPAFDQGFSGLVDDLRGRGLLDSTLVVAVGEFGRTPWINESGGRDHWPGVWSALLAGGGAAGGQVIGASSLDGHPSSRPVSVTELVGTMGHVLGLGADAGITQPVAELFG